MYFTPIPVLETAPSYVSPDYREKWLQEEEERRHGRRLQCAARYAIAFRMRHPIAYYLWYRYRILRLVSKVDRAEVLDYMLWLEKNRARYFKDNEYVACFGPRSLPGGMTALEEFALRHPFLFLFVDFYQTCKKFMSCPSEKVCPLEGEAVAGGSVDLVDSLAVENTLAQKHDDVPSNDGVVKGQIRRTVT